jgi:hypothetical protein
MPVEDAAVRHLEPVVTVHCAHCEGARPHTLIDTVAGVTFRCTFCAVTTTLYSLEGQRGPES